MLLDHAALPRPLWKVFHAAAGRQARASDSHSYGMSAGDRRPAIRQLWSGGLMRAMLTAGSADPALEEAERLGSPVISHRMEGGASRSRIPRARCTASAVPVGSSRGG